MTEYTTKFDELARFAPELVPTPEARALRYFDGLCYGIKSKMSGSEDDPLPVLISRAHLLESQHREFILGKKSQRDESSGRDRKSVV